jgi:CrcB protein
MNKYLLVFFGAGIGGVLRLFFASKISEIFPVFPIGTLLVNTLGSFLIGFIVFGLADKQLISSELKMFLTVGFCGGFTTFSTFSYETLQLFKGSEYLLGSLNIIFSLFFTLLGVYLAYVIFRG